MSFLLDTNVLSDLRRARPADGALLAWFATQPSESLYLSVLTLGEIRQGVERIRRRAPA